MKQAHTIGVRPASQIAPASAWARFLLTENAADSGSGGGALGLSTLPAAGAEPTYTDGWSVFSSTDDEGYADSLQDVPEYRALTPQAGESFLFWFQGEVNLTNAAAASKTLMTVLQLGNGGGGMFGFSINIAVADGRFRTDFRDAANATGIHQSDSTGLISDDAPFVFAMAITDDTLYQWLDGVSIGTRDMSTFDALYAPSTLVNNPAAIGHLLSGGVVTANRGYMGKMRRLHCIKFAGALPSNIDTIMQDVYRLGGRMPWSVDGI